MKDDYAVILDVMKMAARRAGAVMLASKGEKQEIWFKLDANIVTRVDMDAERVIIETLQQAYPGFDFYSEEWGDQRRGADATWLIDPIDGTANFVKGIPLSCVSIAMFSGEEVLLGVVYDPFHEEMFTAVRNEGAYLNGHPIKVSTASCLEGTLILHEWGGPLERIEEGNLLAAGASIRCLEPGELQLPLFDARDDPTTYGPQVDNYLTAIRSAHGIVLGTPVYHGMLSAVLKNALEFVELLASEDPPRLSGKVLALVGVSAGYPNSSGINSMQWACRPLQAWILPKSVATTDSALQARDGQCIDAKTGTQLHTLGSELARWAYIIHQAEFSRS